MEDMQKLFQKETADWFHATLGEPTPVQKQAWPLIASGRHVLVSAPTGTGKTLSAFLVFLDRLKQQAREHRLKRELYVIYISPLKSLAADIRENLKRPLEGIGAGGEIVIGVRTGDTPQKDRQQMVRKPPHILITTPESLYLLLTSKTGRNMLATARAVVLDELHALIDTKRGAHLMLSLARLDRLCGKPLQRIGLSATIEPLEGAARYLAPEEAAVAAPAMAKKIRLEVLGPYANVQGGRRKDPVWEELGKLVFQYCQGSRSVIAFVEGRRYAEKLAYFVNLLGGEGFARVHHGSLSKEQRIQTELALRNGQLRLLCATSSMELGIDVGEIDQVLQVGCPRTVSGTMQRLGRAGHNPGRVSVMYLFPRTAAECISCGMTAQLARQGGVEQVNPPSQCLDVLAQHLVSMAAYSSYDLDEVMEILPRAWPFCSLTKADVTAVLEMLAGDYEHSQDIPARPRVLYDRIHGRVEGDGYSRMLAISAAGTIPDKGLYAVKTEAGVKLGEVDEEFVYESQKGDRFILGSFAWRVVHISRDTVTVEPAQVEGARLPFWKGELKGRDRRTSEAFGRMFHSLQQAHTEGRLAEALEGLGLDETAVSLAAGYLERQIQAAGGLADDKTIVVEHFRDASGCSQLMVHSIFGRRINAPLALLASDAIKQLYQAEVGFVDEEDGFLVYSYGDQLLPEGVLYQIQPDTCIQKLEILLPATPLFHMAFRYNSGRALMMGVRKVGRQPLWMQRLRSAQMLEQVVREPGHPLMRETRRECLQELWDSNGVKELLEDIRSGAVAVREIYTQTPSPMSLPLQWAQEAAVMYDYAPTTRGVYAAVEEAGKGFAKTAQQGLQPDRQELLQAQGRDPYLKLPEDEKQLHALLMAEGDLAAGELEVLPEWLDQLAKDGRVRYLEQGLWIAAEQAEEYEAALNQEGTLCKQQLSIVRRMLRYRGAADVAQIAERYGWTESMAQEILAQLCQNKDVAEQDGRYYHAKLYRRARMQTLKKRRSQVQTVPAQAYADLLLSCITTSIPSEECLQNTLQQYAGVVFPAPFWETVLLCARVKNYREAMLDTYLARGELFWHMDGKGGLCFERQADIDWDAGPDPLPPGLDGQEQVLYQALLRRGASFAQALSSLLPDAPVSSILLSLMERGLVYADSFTPVRQWLAQAKQVKTSKTAVKHRAGMRAKALHAGRWDIVRPLKAALPSASAEKRLEDCFHRMLVLSKETAAACGLPWQEALSVLRIWEYTGQARRGYFVDGMSGAQFILGRDYASIVRRLQGPGQGLVWINAADPAQPWGKILPHKEGRGFLNVPGTAVACVDGLPVAVLERQGKVLRIFEESHQAACLKQFVQGYRQGQLFPACKRIVVKEYPGTAKGDLSAAGFIKEMQDFALYR